jgi:hypothetical protein
VRIGVHYIAFWCVFGLCGILPLEILDFCGHTRIFLMKAPQQSPSVHHIEHYTFLRQTCQNCVHAQMSTISITAHSHASMPKLRTLRFCYAKMSKLRHTICAVHHYTFPIQNAQMSTISITAHSHASMSKFRHTICAVNHYTFFIQTCQNCVHAQMSTISITAHSHASMSKLRHTICAVNHYTFFYTNMSKLRPCTNVHHINHCTFPCKHDKIASTSKCGSTISTYAIQACQKCVTQFVQSITALLLCKMRP